MPESRKVALHGQLRDEVMSLGELLPGLNLALLADGAMENWRILGQIKADLEAAGFLPASVLRSWTSTTRPSTSKRPPTCVLGRVAPHRARYETLRLILRDNDDGVEQVLKQLRTYSYTRARASARTAWLPRSATSTKTRTG